MGQLTNDKITSLIKWILSESGCLLITKWVIKFVQYQNIWFIFNLLFLSRLQCQTIFSSVTEDRHWRFLPSYWITSGKHKRQVFLKVKMKSSYLKAGSFIFLQGIPLSVQISKTSFIFDSTGLLHLSFQQEINCTEMCGVVFVSQWFSDTFSIKVRGTLVCEQWPGVSGKGYRVGEHHSPCSALFPPLVWCILSASGSSEMVCRCQ